MCCVFYDYFNPEQDREVCCIFELPVTEIKLYFFSSLFTAVVTVMKLYLGSPHRGA